jgi:transcriptional pleiotropic regulator of transition state genes
MRATGIVRRIDDLHRVVIPKEICRSMGIREGDPLEFYIDTETNGICLVPYRCDCVDDLRAIAESLNTLGQTPEHWEISDQLKEIAKKLEKLG